VEHGPTLTELWDGLRKFSLEAAENNQKIQHEDSEITQNAGGSNSSNLKNQGLSIEHIKTKEILEVSLSKRITIINDLKNKVKEKEKIEIGEGNYSYVSRYSPSCNWQKNEQLIPSDKRLDDLLDFIDNFLQKNFYFDELDARNNYSRNGNTYSFHRREDLHIPVNIINLETENDIDFPLDSEFPTIYETTLLDRLFFKNEVFEQVITENNPSNRFFLEENIEVLFIFSIFFDLLYFFYFLFTFIISFFNYFITFIYFFFLFTFFIFLFFY
jgi:hypothetical protein